MARLQDFASITPTSSDSVLGVQSAGQGLIGIDTALSSSTSRIPTSAAVKNAMNVYVDTSVSDRVHISLPTYFDDQVHGVSLKLYDTNNVIRTELTNSGLNFYNASGTLTAKYPSTAKTDATVSTTYANQPIVFMRSGNTVTMYLRDPKGLAANALTDLGTIIPSGFRPYVVSGLSLISFDFLNTVRIFVYASGQLQIYNYTANTGIINLASAFTWAAD